VRRVVHLGEVLEIEPRVDLRGGDAGVAQQFLHAAQVLAGFQQVRRKGMPEQVRVQAHGQVLGAGELRQAQLDGACAQASAGSPDKYGLLLRAGQRSSFLQPAAQRGNGLDMNQIAGGLDRILPGLGSALRNNSGGLATIGIAVLGEPRDVEGRKGISLPLRFRDGAMFLGPVPIGQAAPLF